jgi:hypothetical protein
VAVTKGTGEDIGGWVDQSNACHGFVGERGAAHQYKDFDRAAYGVLEGNYRGVVTIETWDGLSPATATGDDLNADPWTSQQAERIADWIAWAAVDLGIPIQRLYGTRTAGHGPHGTGIKNRESRIGLSVYEGPDKWSTSTTKACPGDKRILQLYGPHLDGGSGSILARARVIRDGVKAGRFDWLPRGDVDLSAALARGETVSWWRSWFAA